MNSVYRTPHVIAKRILGFFLPGSADENGLGDYEELYHFEAENGGYLHADLWFWGQVLRAVFPFLYANVQISFSLLLNFLLIAARSIRRHKGYSFISVGGLGLGLACGIMMFAYTWNELTYEHFIPDYERIYRVNKQNIYIKEAIVQANVPNLLAEELRSSGCRYGDVTRINPGNFTVRGETGLYEEKQAYYIDQYFFDVFHLKFILGSPETALSGNRFIILTRTAALRYFGRIDVLGENILIDNVEMHTVSGILEDLPENSHMKIAFLVPYKLFDNVNIDSWLMNPSRVYVRLKKGTAVKQIENILQNIVNKNIPPEFEKVYGVSYQAYKDKGNDIRLTLQGISGIHFSKLLLDESDRKGNIRYVVAFSVIGLIIFLAGTVNFINFSVMRSSERFREIGIRAVFGSQKTGIIRQFIVESAALSILGGMLAVLMLFFLVKTLPDLFSGEIFLPDLFGIPLLSVLIFAAFAAGLAGGIYPALAVTGCRPAGILKNRVNNMRRITFFRNGVLLFQCSISLVLVISVFVIYRQLNFIKDKDPGFLTDRIMAVESGFWLMDNANDFKREISAYPGVVHISGSISSMDREFGELFFEHESGGKKQVAMTRYKLVDTEYLETYGLQLVFGRGFTKEDYYKDVVILNQKAVDALGITNPVGSTIKRALSGKTGRKHTVIGVVKDFHYSSYHYPVQPLLLRPYNAFQVFSIRIRPENRGETIDFIKKTWQKYAPGHPLTYTFVKTKIDDKYTADRKLWNMLSISAVAAALLAVMGMTGLVYYTLSFRSKEIGIRKALGSSKKDLIFLFSGDFLRKIIIANVIACPAAYITSSTLLNTFAYRISIKAPDFLIAGILSLLITLLIASAGIFKVAGDNPVKFLKSE